MNGCPDQVRARQVIAVEITGHTNGGHPPRKRGIQYAAASRPYRWRFGILGGRSSRATTWEYGALARDSISKSPNRHSERKQSAHCRGLPTGISLKRRKAQVGD